MFVVFHVCESVFVVCVCGCVLFVCVVFFCIYV